MEAKKQQEEKRHHVEGEELHKAESNICQDKEAARQHDKHRHRDEAQRQQVKGWRHDIHRHHQEKKETKQQEDHQCHKQKIIQRRDEFNRLEKDMERCNLERDAFKQRIASTKV